VWVALVLAGIALLGAVVGWAWMQPGSDRIATGVRIALAAPVDLSGATQASALAAIETAAATTAERSFSVQAGDKVATATLREWGVTLDPAATVTRAFEVGRSGGWADRQVELVRARFQGRDLAPAWTMDETQATRTLQRLAPSSAPRDATARVVNGRVEVVPEQVGFKLDPAAAVAELRGRLAQGLPASVVLPGAAKAPRVTADQLREVDTVLADFSTSFAGSSRNRIHNVTLAAKALDGHVVFPGETFSYDRVVGPRTREHGFRIAPVIINGELVPGEGGGACQVSSTLYNTVLLANLAIVARSHHSEPVHYVPPGRDATVAWGAIDFKFRNPTAYPVVLHTAIEGRNLRMQALGHGPAPKVQLIRQVGGRIGASTTVRTDPALRAGARVVDRKPRAGWRVTLVRVVGEGSAATQQVISRDVYRAQAGIVRVGPAAATTPPANAPLPTPPASVPPLVAPTAAPAPTVSENHPPIGART
jgi:vancomycin resistance protein YoaR